ncbi:CDF-like metal transporter [Pholiota molesta]|nr:CDF-like metal transporter [Pholiota molesta]
MADCKASSESTLSKVHISPPFWPFFLSICHQSSDIVVPDQTEFHSDIERASGSTALIPVDPYQIRDGILTEEELAGLRRRRKGKAVAKYQSRQNNLISALLKPMEEHTEDAKAEEEALRLPVKIAIYASLICNFALCILQLYAAISSLSLSLLATGIDSVFDIGSNVLLFWLHRKANSLDINKWPVGGARLETIGNIVYGNEDCNYNISQRMGSVNFVVIVESAHTLISKKGDALAPFHLPSIIAVAAALAVKGFLFLYSYSLRKSSSQVQVLWQDHRNDLWINGFGILMSCGGSKLRWYLDPVGAIIIALGVIISWGRTIYQEFELLAGKSAPHEFLQLVIYKAATFTDEIEKVDTVRAYHDYFVEVDVVMDANTPLWKAHDISQQLQDKIEVLPNVDRAFVHVDHEWTHVPEHRKPKSPM